MSEGEQRSYSVVGMTCEHCVAAVRQEVGQLAGVREVEVDLDSGALVVHGSDLDEQAVRGAVESADATFGWKGGGGQTPRSGHRQSVTRSRSRLYYNDGSGGGAL